MSKERAQSEKEPAEATERPRSRREVLAGAAGALGVVAAEAIAHMPAARASDGDPVLAGQANESESTTILRNTTGGFAALSLESRVNTGLYAGGAQGYPGVEAVGGSGGPGGLESGVGVEGRGAGLFDSSDKGGVGILGRGTHGNAGVVGVGDGTGAGLVGTGGDSGGNGVEGTGAGAGFGVKGQNDTGFGVVGLSSGGVGVHAESGSGIALEVQGRVTFRQSGTAWIGTGRTSTRVALDETQFLGTSSFVLATLQQLRAGVWVAAVVPNVAGHAFTIYLNQAVAQATKVGWFIIG